MKELENLFNFIQHILERPDFEGGLILRQGCSVEHVVSWIAFITCHLLYVKYYFNKNM